MSLSTATKNLWHSSLWELRSEFPIQMSPIRRENPIVWTHYPKALFTSTSWFPFLFETAVQYMINTNSSRWTPLIYTGDCRVPPGICSSDWEYTAACCEQRPTGNSFFPVHERYTSGKSTVQSLLPSTCLALRAGLYVQMLVVRGNIFCSHTHHGML